MERSRYLAFVPIKWGETINEFKVEIEHRTDLGATGLEEIKQAARDHVTSRGQEIIESKIHPIKVYRKK